MIQYGSPIKPLVGPEIEVVRQGSITMLDFRGPLKDHEFHFTYPQLLQLITRLQEAAKDAAGAKR